MVYNVTLQSMSYSESEFPTSWPEDEEWNVNPDWVFYISSESTLYVEPIDPNLKGKQYAIFVGAEAMVNETVQEPVHGSIGDFSVSIPLPPTFNQAP